MKNKEIIEHINQLSAFTKEKLPVKLSFAVAKNLNKLREHYKDYEEERNKLLDLYNVKDNKKEPAYKATGNIEIAKESVTDWNKDATELLEIEVEVEVHEVDFVVIEQLELSVADAEAIRFMIKE